MANLRLQKDLEGIENDLPVNAKIEWPDKNVLTEMRITVTPAKESIWAGGKVIIFFIFYKQP